MLEFNSKEEREQYVFELYKQGKTIREIAQIVHMSFRGIGAKIKTGYEDNESNETEKKKEPVFNSTKAFKLFSQGKAPIEVAIKLDLEYEENIQNYF
jgi:transposase